MRLEARQLMSGRPALGRTGHRSCQQKLRAEFDRLHAYYSTVVTRSPRLSRNVRVLEDGYHLSEGKVRFCRGIGRSGGCAIRLRTPSSREWRPSMWSSGSVSLWNLKCDLRVYRNRLACKCKNCGLEALPSVGRKTSLLTSAYAWAFADSIRSTAPRFH